MVLLTVPVVMMGALYGVKFAGLPNNLYVQIGMVVLMGLASKNAIVVVSFGFGVLPLVLASGAGAMTQKSVGVTIFAGILMASFVSTVLVPVYYVALEELRERFVSVEDEMKKRDSI